jgi:hypothetical protein
MWFARYSTLRKLLPLWDQWRTDLNARFRNLPMRRGDASSLRGGNFQRTELTWRVVSIRKELKSVTARIKRDRA